MKTKHVTFLALITVMISGSFTQANLVSDYQQDKEFVDAISWMYKNNVTKYNQVDQFNPEGIVLREHAAKFLTEFSVNVMLKFINTNDSNCDFKDLIQWDPTLTNSILNSCYLDIFYGNNQRFYPTQALTKAEAIVALVRTIDGKQPEVDELVRRGNYTLRANELWLSKETDPAIQDRIMTRYEMALLLYRARVKVKE